MSDPIVEALREIREDQREMRMTLQEMARALAQIAVVEERISATQESLRRAFTTIERHEERIIAIEKAEPEQTRAAQWVTHGVWAAACAAVAFVAHRAGLL